MYFTKYKDLWLIEGERTYCVGFFFFLRKYCFIFYVYFIYLFTHFTKLKNTRVPLIMTVSIEKCKNEIKS